VLDDQVDMDDGLSILAFGGRLHLNSHTHICIPAWWTEREIKGSELKPNKIIMHGLAISQLSKSGEERSASTYRSINWE
jgi:hypothetical protein